VGPPPSVAACRAAVRAAVRDLADEPALVLVACSGGPDSTALLDAALTVAPHVGLTVGVLTVDHGLQTGSAERARAVAAFATARGAAPVSVWHVRVDGSGGMEAAARERRRAAYCGAAAASGAVAVLLGHTRDDQAETVLLGLARGSGARSLGGMSVRSGLLRRPLLHLSRATVHEAARAVAGAPLWHDPHNDDSRYARSRVRAQALPALERSLGPGVTAALARTADLLRDDADALDAWALAEAGRLVREPGDVDAVGLSALPTAVRTRVLRRAALGAGCAASALTAAHVRALDALVCAAPPHPTTSLPGGRVGERVGGRLLITLP
jgi:tRNA(Ile)-lysidine synthase